MVIKLIHHFVMDIKSNYDVEHLKLIYTNFTSIEKDKEWQYNTKMCSIT